MSDEKIQSWLVPAIITTICCCLPFGIVAIIHASKVSSLAAAGDIEGAKKAASNAKLWSLLGIGIGVVANLIYIAITVFSQTAAEM